MSLAIKFGDSSNPSSVSGAIYFDAVTDYRKTYSGRVTEHPIEAGASVSDHYIADNPKIKISGVISSVDFSYIPSILALDGEPVLNKNSLPQAVSVSGLGGKLKSFIPDIISQFLPTVDPDVNLDTSSRTNYKDSVDMMMMELLNGLFYNQERQRWENRMTPTTLYGVDAGSAAVILQDLIITKFESEESVENGDALFFEMEMEQVRFVTLESAEAPKPSKNSSTARATAPTKNKGNAPSTPRDSSKNPPAAENVITKVGRATRRGE